MDRINLRPLLFPRGSFFFLALGFSRFYLRGMDGIGKIFAIRESKASVEIIKGTGTRSVTNRKAGNNGVQMIFLMVSGKSGVKSYFKFSRNKKSPEHMGREPWLRPKDRITILHKGRVSIFDRSRDRNFTRICQVESGREVAALG